MGGIIINADDFGWTPGVNRSVARLAELGTLSSTSVMVNMPHAGDLPGLLRDHPALGLGVHLTLTDGRPVSPAAEVRALLDPDGRFLSPGPLVRKLRRGRIPARQVVAELRAQIRRARDLAGPRLDHWDSHHHIHRYEPLYTLFVRTCAREGLGAMRAHKHYWPDPGRPPRPLRPGGGLRGLLTEGYYRAEVARCSRHFALPRGILILDGLGAVARLRPEDLDGIYEVLTHPATETAGLVGTGLVDERVEQFDALRAPEVIQSLSGPGRRIDLVRFADLTGPA